MKNISIKVNSLGSLEDLKPYLEKDHRIAQKTISAVEKNLVRNKKKSFAKSCRSVNRKKRKICFTSNFGNG